MIMTNMTKMWHQKRLRVLVFGLCAPWFVGLGCTKSQPKSTQVKIEKPPAEWVRLGVPKEVKLGGPQTSEQWGAYTIGFSKRAVEKTVTKMDYEIYSHYLSVEIDSDGQFAKYFSPSLFCFRHTPYRQQMIPIAGRLLNYQDEHTQFYAAAALAHYGDKESAPRIAALLKTHNAEHRGILEKLLKEKLDYESSAEKSQLKP